MKIDADRLFQNVDIVEETIQYGYTLCQENKISDVISLLDDLVILLLSTENLLAKDDGHLVPLAIACCKNMRNSITNFKANPDKQMRIYRLEIMNLSWNLNNIINNQYRIIANGMNENYANMYLERASHMHELVKQNKNKHYKYKVSIQVTAYNKLEYTKAAIESIYKYTDLSNGDIELITLNNGSSDGTEEYFESLPNTKKINYKYNAIGTIINPNVFEGRYVVGFSNDVVATPNWLDNLMKCIESDDNIIMVVPTCQDYAVSNLQGIEVDYQNNFSDLPKMEKFACQYNHSNSLLWEERPVLMPFVSMVRREVVEGSLQDPMYIQAQFLDDDISTVFRRTGWKQILAKDTFMHHFGSVTLRYCDGGGADSIRNMRKVYFDKWKVDALLSRGRLPLFKCMFEWVSSPDNANVLWLEPLFGNDFFELKNIYKKKNNKQFKYTKALLSDAKYKQDAEMNFSQLEVYNDLYKSLKNDDKKYDIITMSRCLNDFVQSDFFDIVKTMVEKLSDGGWLLLPIRNCRSAYDICNYILGNTGNFDNNGVPNYVRDVLSYNQVEITSLLQNLNTMKQHLSCQLLNVIGNDENVDKIVDGIKIILSKETLDESLYNNLKCRMYWLVIKKVQKNSE